MSILANGKTISVGSTGFDTDYLTLKKFTQLGSLAQTLSLTGTGAVNYIDCVFNGNLTLTAIKLIPFCKAKGKPIPIVTGKKLNLYLSITVYRQDTMKFEGTIFAHGLFFAHEKEPAFFTGPKTEVYFPVKPTIPVTKWDRSPSDYQ